MQYLFHSTPTKYSRELRVFFVCGKQACVAPHNFGTEPTAFVSGDKILGVRSEGIFGSGI